MSEGRAELQRIILQYEKQRADALRSKQESEVVLPFVRAALEELDSAMGNNEDHARMERVQSQVESARTPHVVVPEPKAEEHDGDEVEDQEPISIPTPVSAMFGESSEDSNSRGGASIASLLEDDSKAS